MQRINSICIDENGELIPSRELVEVARKITGGKVLLAFSGRDSLACWLRLRGAGFECIPYFCYTVPHLSYDDEMLGYYERFFGTHIIRLPHPRTYELLRVAAYLHPSAWNVVGHMHLNRFEFADIESTLAKQFGLDPLTYLCAIGMRSADNLMRQRMIKQFGTIGMKRRHYYYAVWDWKTAEVKNFIESCNCKLSKSYLYFGSTGDGIDYRFLRFLKDNLPEDYKRVLDVFPLAEAELFRYEVVK